MASSAINPTLTEELLSAKSQLGSGVSTTLEFEGQDHCSGLRCPPEYGVDPDLDAFINNKLVTNLKISGCCGITISREAWRLISSVVLLLPTAWSFAMQQRAGHSQLAYFDFCSANVTTTHINPADNTTYTLSNITTFDFDKCVQCNGGNRTVRYTQSMKANAGAIAMIVAIMVLLYLAVERAHRLREITLELLKRGIYVQLPKKCCGMLECLPFLSSLRLVALVILTTLYVYWVVAWGLESSSNVILGNAGRRNLSLPLGACFGGLPYGNVTPGFKPDNPTKLTRWGGTAAGNPESESFVVQTISVLVLGTAVLFFPYIPAVYHIFKLYASPYQLLHFYELTTTDGVYRGLHEKVKYQVELGSLTDAMGRMPWGRETPKWSQEPSKCRRALHWKRWVAHGSDVASFVGDGRLPPGTLLEHKQAHEALFSYRTSLLVALLVRDGMLEPLPFNSATPGGM